MAIVRAFSIPLLRLGVTGVSWGRSRLPLGKRRARDGQETGCALDSAVPLAGSIVLYCRRCLSVCSG